jgi:hypothetical protein
MICINERKYAILLMLHGVNISKVLGCQVIQILHLSMIELKGNRSLGIANISEGQIKNLICILLKYGNERNPAYTYF